MSGRKQVLLVDDDTDVLSALRRALRDQVDVWEMYFVQTVDEALHRVRTTALDVVVTDLTMPGKDGFYLLRTLQASEATRNISVIVLTGMGERHIKRRALQEGAVDLLNKPIIAEDLIARLRNVLRLKSYQDQLA